MCKYTPIVFKNQLYILSFILLSMNREQFLVFEALGEYSIPDMAEKNSVDFGLFWIPKYQQYRFRYQRHKGGFIYGTTVGRFCYIYSFLYCPTRR